MAKGKSHCVEHNGQPMSLREFADAIGIPQGTIMRRWSKGDRGERLMRKPDGRYRPKHRSDELRETTLG